MMRWIEGLPGRSLASALRQDRPLAWLTLALALATLVPLTLTSFLPFVDLPGNVANAGLLLPTALGKGITGQHYEVLWRPIPYWTAYLLLALFNSVAGPLLAAKALVALLVLALPLCAMRLLLALGRSPRIGLWAFALVWDRNLYWGWVTFLLGMILSMVLLARLLEARTLRESARLIPLAVLVALTHLEGVAFLLVTGGLIGLLGRPLGPSFLRAAVGVSGALVAVLPWLQGAVGGAGARAPLRLWYPKIGEKISLLFSNSIDNLPGVWAQGATALAVAVWIFWIPVLAARSPQPGEEDGRPLAPLLASLLLYFGLPDAITGPVEHWSTYPRFATYLLLSLLFVPRGRFKGREALWLAPGVVAAFGVAAAVAQQFRAFGAQVEPFRELFALVEPDRRLLPLSLENQEASIKEPALEQMHGYLAAARRLYDPKIFDHPTNPLQFRSEGRLPHVAWRSGQPFSMDRHGRFYDYILVQGISRDPVAALVGKSEPPVRLLREAGRWRLYAVERPR